MAVIAKKETACLLLICLCNLFLQAGCANFGKKLKAFMAGESPGQDVAMQEPLRLSTPRFSETESVPYDVDRKYRRMNRNRFEEEAEVNAAAGSLWVMEGQGAYFFAQNTTRLVGDLLNVKIEGAPKTQLQTKTRVIAKLLERLERPEPSFIRGLAQSAASNGQPAPGAKTGKQAGSNQVAAPQESSEQQGQASSSAGPGSAGTRYDAPFAVQAVPTRIVEVLRDGSYRVKGSQEFMIGKRDYKVIVTGIVRPEDFNESGIEADRLLDAQFDIVSEKRGVSL